MPKQKLRIWAKEERKKLDIQALSDLLVSKLRTFDCYIQAKNVMLFYPLENEINLFFENPAWADNMIREKADQIYKTRKDA